MNEVPNYTIQPSFARGEVSPFMFGRVDLAGWASGLRTLRNFTVRPEGAVMNRPGFALVGNALVNTARGSILIPFAFSATQSYVIEVGNGTAQAFSLGAVVDSANSVAITAGSLTYYTHPPGWRLLFTTAAPHGLSVGMNANISGVVGTGSFSKANGTQLIVDVPPNATQFTVGAYYGNSGTYTSGGTVVAPLSFATPWAQADLAGLRWAQSADTLTVVHSNYPPYEIKRTSAVSFTCLPALYSNGPFLPQNSDGVTFVSASAVTGTVTLTANAPIFNANHVGALFQLTQQDLSAIPPWEPTKKFGASPIGLMRRASLKNYKCVSVINPSAADWATGTWLPSHTQGTQSDGDGNAITGTVGSAGVNWQYQDSGYGVVKITQYQSPTQVQGVVQPNYPGGASLLPISCVGGIVTAFGPFTFSGNGTTTTFSPLTGITTSDPSKFVVTIGGVVQPTSSYTINLPAVSITFYIPPPVGAGNIVVRQISGGLGQTSYWAFGAFSADQGYPSAVSYFPDRLVLAATRAQPVGVFGSKTSDYHNFGVSTPVVASDAFAVFLNARQLNAISDLIPLSDLLIGTSNIIWRLWPGQTGTALSPLAIAATPQNYYGQSPSCAATLLGDSAIFPEYDGRRLRDLIYQFAFDKFMGQELTLYSRHLVPFGTRFQRLAYKPDASGQLVFGLRSDGVLLVCTYLREHQVIGWARWDTQGTIEDICVVPETSAFSLYAIVNRSVAGQSQRYVERLSSREVTSLYDYRFLDCSLTYDGRNTSSTTMAFSGGTTWKAGDTGLVTASSATGWANFQPSDVTNSHEVWLYDSLGNRARALITGIVSPLIANVMFRDPVPATLQFPQTATWTLARTSFTGATQLAGTAAVAYVDGNVYGIPAVAAAPDGSLTVGADGSVTLPVAGGVVTVGLPYLCDFETLPLNLQGQQTIRMRAKAEPIIYLDVTETRNFLAGTDFVNMMPNKERAFEAYTVPTSMQEGVLWTRVPSTLDSECHTCIRQAMPLPITIRGHIPQILIGQPVG